MPSATEMVCALGLADRLVGVTHECDHPRWVQGLPKVTHTLIPTDASSGTIDGLVRERLDSGRALYTLNLSVLEELRPELIITQALCDVCAVDEEEVIAAACSLPGHPEILSLEPESLPEVLDALRAVGAATGVEAHAEIVSCGLQVRVEEVAARTLTLERRRRVAFLEWLDPLFSGGHWNPEIVRLAGGLDPLGVAGKPSRTLSPSEVVAAEPDLVFIACCGYSTPRTLHDLPALSQTVWWRALPAVRAGEVYVADGSHFFSRPGPRLVDSLEILAHTLHPGLHPLPPGLPGAIRATTHLPGVELPRR